MGEFCLFESETELVRWAAHYRVSRTLAQAVRTYVYNVTGGEPDEDAALQIVNDPNNEERDSVESIALSYANIKKESEIIWGNKAYFNIDEVDVIPASMLN